MTFPIVPGFALTERLTDDVLGRRYRGYAVLDRAPVFIREVRGHADAAVPYIGRGGEHQVELLSVVITSVDDLPIDGVEVDGVHVDDADVDTADVDPSVTGVETALVYAAPPSRSLAEVLADRDGALSPGELVGLLAPLAESVAGLHEANLVHAAIDERSVRVDSSGSVLLADLGVRAVQPAPGNRTVLAEPRADATDGADESASEDEREGTDGAANAGGGNQGMEASDARADVVALARLGLLALGEQDASEPGAMGPLSLDLDAASDVADVLRVARTQPGSAADLARSLREAADPERLDPPRGLATPESIDLTARLRSMALTPIEDDEPAAGRRTSPSESHRTRGPSRSERTPTRAVSQEREQGARRPAFRGARPRSDRSRATGSTRGSARARGHGRESRHARHGFPWPDTHAMPPYAVPLALVVAVAVVAAILGVGMLTGHRDATPAALTPPATTATKPSTTTTTSTASSGPSPSSSPSPAHTRVVEDPIGDRSAPRTDPVALVQQLADLRARAWTELDLDAVAVMDAPKSPAFRQDKAAITRAGSDAVSYHDLTFVVSSATTRGTGPVKGEAPESRVVIDAVIDTPAYAVHRRGSPSTDVPADLANRVTLTLVWTGDGWQVHGVRTGEGPAAG